MQKIQGAHTPLLGCKIVVTGPVDELSVLPGLSAGKLYIYSPVAVLAKTCDMLTGGHQAFSGNLG